MKKLLLTLLALSMIFSSSATSQIDVLIEKKICEQNLTLSPLCDDATFIRRLSLTLTGRLPLLEDTQKFINSQDKDKRSKLIEQLLSTEAYVDYFVMKWGDLLRIKSEFPSNHWPNAVQAYNRWLREQIRPNVPYNEMVYNLLTSSGSNFRHPAVNFFRAFQTRESKLISDNVSVLFTGERTSPKSFHPFFSQLQYKSTGEWKEEIVYVDLDKKPELKTVVMPDGKAITLRENVDLRKDFANWLTSPSNPYFGKVMANRVWYWLMGRGVIDPPDDITPSTEASNPELLAYLEKEFISSGFDVKKLFYLILSSDAFSRSSLSATDKEQGAIHFAYYPTTRLNSEQLLDAINDVTGIFDKYISRVPEPYSYFPMDIRAVQLGDGTVTSAQIELFGRPSRDVSLESDRNNDLNSKQVLYLLNSAEILRKISASQKIKTMVSSSKDFDALITNIYLTLLSRYPKANELSVLKEACAPLKNNQQVAENLIWAMFNNAEFLFNH